MQTRSLAALAGLLAMSILGSNPAQAAQPYCREFTKDIIVAGRVQQGYGTACLQPDGAWKVVNEVRPDPVANATPRYDRERVIYKQPAPVVYESYYTYLRTYYRYPSSSFSIRIGDNHRHKWKHPGRGYGHYKHDRRRHH